MLIFSNFIIEMNLEPLTIGGILGDCSSLFIEVVRYGTGLFSCAVMHGIRGNRNLEGERETNKIQ